MHSLPVIKYSGDVCLSFMRCLTSFPSHTVCRQTRICESFIGKAKLLNYDKGMNDENFKHIYHNIQKVPNCFFFCNADGVSTQNQRTEYNYWLQEKMKLNVKKTCILKTRSSFCPRFLVQQFKAGFQFGHFVVRISASQDFDEKHDSVLFICTIDV